jgi:hypothetical protein
MQFASPLSAVQWAVLAGIPVGIIALYFLKLRRRPVQVSSTLLWRRSLEDLHVNSLFQRLRRNLLLFLQLLAVGLAMFALAGPRVKGSAGQGQRTILLLDNSASMGATDVSPTRLDAAKREAERVIDAMGRDDLAMILAFSDRARVVSNYTGNRALLRQRLRSIRPSQGTTNLKDALVVASGLANPSSDLAARALPQGQVAVKNMIPPKLLIYTDGGFPDVEGFSVGNLVPEVVVVGPPAAAPKAEPEPGKVGSQALTAAAPNASPPADNVGILALQSATDPEKPGEYQVFGRVHNYRDEPVELEARLLRHDPAKPGAEPALIDAVALELPPQAEKAFQFDLADTGAAGLEVRIEPGDALALDDRAYTVFGNPRKAQVLLVTAGNRYLLDSLQTATMADLVDLVAVNPQQLASAEVTREVAAGRYDLVVFDAVRPAAAPEANTLYFGALPPGAAFDAPRAVEAPVILDWNVAHPLLQYVRDLSLVRIAKASVGDLPTGATPLIESNAGPLAFALPRGGFTDVVIGFGLMDGTSFNTDWQVRYSYPLFLLNVVRVLGNIRDSAGEEFRRPGEPIALRADTQAETVTMTGPNGRPERLSRSPQGTFLVNDADAVGLYHTSWEPRGSGLFAVNLFDARESDIAPRGMVPEGTPPDQADAYRIKIGNTAVAGVAKSRPAMKDWWKPLSVAVLGVLLLEWYIYNRRVYV